MKTNPPALRSTIWSLLLLFLTVSLRAQDTNPPVRFEPDVKIAMRDGVELTGTTIHVQTADVDGEPYIVQAEVPVLPGDDEASLLERIKVRERERYVPVLKMWVNFHEADPSFRWPTK